MRWEKKAREGRVTYLHRVSTDVLHSEFSSEEFSVHAEWVTCESSGSERKSGDTTTFEKANSTSIADPEEQGERVNIRKEVTESIEITGERVGVREEEVRESDGLSSLQYSDDEEKVSNLRL